MEPEIPPNTGAIGRLCLATQSRLHLVEPLGFDISDRQLKRAGLDYWQYLDVIHHASLQEFITTLPPGAPLVFFSKKAPHLLYEHRFQPGTYLVFGNETQGLSAPLLRDNLARTLRLPIYDERVRSLNLSTAVGIAVYEALRQLGP